MEWTGTKNIRKNIIEDKISKRIKPKQVANDCIISEPNLTCDVWGVLLSCYQNRDIYLNVEIKTSLLTDVFPWPTKITFGMLRIKCLLDIEIHWTLHHITSNCISEFSNISALLTYLRNIYYSNYILLNCFNILKWLTHLEGIGPEFQLHQDALSYVEQQPNLIELTQV